MNGEIPRLRNLLWLEGVVEGQVAGLRELLDSGKPGKATSGLFFEQKTQVLTRGSGRNANW